MDSADERCGHPECGMRTVREAAFSLDPAVAGTGPDCKGRELGMQARAGDNAGERVEERLADFFEIPKDVLLDMPRVVIIGNVQVSLENHHGLVEYSQERVRVSTSRGEVVVEGKALSISRITKTGIAVDGRIRRVTLWE